MTSTAVRGANLRVNLLANFAGSAWVAVAQLFVVPVYVKFMGVEGYGLIAFYVLLFAISQSLDLGITPTINRQLARYSTQPADAQDARNLVRTLQTGYWLIGLCIGAAIATGAPSIAESWFKSTSAQVGDVRRVVVEMGLLAIFQWPLSFYYGGLMGLQKQVPLNVVKIGFGILTLVGSVFVLAFVSPTIQSLLLWQILVAGLQVAFVALTLWHYLPMSGQRARFEPAIITGVWRFAAGMSTITVAALVLTQSDKLILSRLLDLRTFGYYALAGVVANALFIFIAPVFGALMPRLSALVAQDDRAAVTRVYHRGAQLMVVLIAPLASVLILFAEDILTIWLGNADAARSVAPLASVLIVGTALNGLMNVPHALQLAYGWTKIGSSISLLLVMIFVPALVALTSLFGAFGAATAWAGVNALYMLVAIPLTHRRLLPTEVRRWALQDTAFPLLAAVTVALAGRAILREPMQTAIAVAAIGVVLIAAFAAAALAAPDIRTRVLDTVRAN